MTDEPARPDPDALLAQVTAEAAAARRGKLKIFFGAAPGVGKTYTMLSAAREARAQGVDAVVGVVETHGRPETEALLDGLEVLPRRRVEYRGHTLAEFDLDAALARHPPLLLVDELAHTNAPGSRHPKRWQDVEELLGAGIDVWTTLNVQHLESLNDVVGGITGVRVWETVPDRVFDAADEVALVDLPPDDLLTRLKEGKVYLPAQAAMAAEHFFRRANLIALRDLSLRRLAERVDAQVQTARAAGPGARVWATAESLLVCVGPGDTDGKLIRSAARLASKLDARWHAVYIETPRLQRLPEDRRSAILATLRLAQELGAETAVLTAPDIVDAALDYARAHNLGRILIGRRARPQRRWWGRFMRRLGERAPDIDLIAVARSAEAPPAPRPTPPPAVPGGRFAPYVGAAALCVAVTVAATPLRHVLELTNIVMLFQLAVVGAAFRWGRGPAVLAAVLSVALFDFFFVPPRFTFAVSDVQYLVTFAVMLVVGLAIGQLMAQLRYQARIAGHREQRIRSLYEMARELAAALSETQVAQIGERFLAATFHARVRVLLADAHGKLTAPAEAMPQVDLAIAQWCFDHGEPAGLGTDTLPAAAAAYLPLKAPAGTQGVLAVQPDNRRLLHIPEQRRLLETHATLIAMALERLHFVTQVHQTRLGAASERLRSTLLAALSHDLRTPLTALVGLADTLTLRLLAAQAPEHETAAAIRDQALRTSHMVDNLLEMARLQSGTVTPRRDWLALEEIVGAAVRALEPALADHPLQTDLPADLPLVQGDATMLERVLVNLLDNAIKYTPPGTPIGITAAVAGDALEVAVWDAGPGLPPGQEQVLFERFARGTRESAIAGVGLGLAICQAIVTAHGGHIRAENRPEGGARFVFTLPLAPPPAAPREPPSSTAPH
ncbi:two-component system sensor histidine kinase KdpD [Immundisolibacter sp.]|uniref:two-component system sensor histidine kinase KdpD n=1 Tax=Immundisolibacter sp. TaxID=1934948 RepID=UPI0026375551|nr:two-component system sensor histidine kinase KdpD [Immundisolibacter sp.]MDD3651238.1 two-component system sensor histidine kinase KdpD [Immundisolibacter sp.]